MTETSTVDTGTGYGRETPSYDARLAEVGPGTPMGEVLRRYWQPIAVSAQLTSDTPHRTRILGENLVVFRDGQGRPGVVFERCSHRGSSLFFGRVEEDGIRCCYHGWKFDVQGHCLEQALEPDRGRRREVARQPWYPVEERYGLVFVYMGPPERKPALPRYDALEPLGEGDQYYAAWPIPGLPPTGLVSDFSWLNMYDNAWDPAHVCWLHSNHSGYQIMGSGTTGLPEAFFDPEAVQDNITYTRTEFGAKYDHLIRDKAANGDARERSFRTELHLPNVFALPDYVSLATDQGPDQMMWVVPMDDTHHRVFFSIRSSDPERVSRFAFGIKQNGKDLWELTEEERQQFPGDGEAQASQGAIPMHSEETLATTDRGVVMLRRMLKSMIDDVEAGRDPLGVSTLDGPPRRVDAGIYTLSTGTAQTAATAPAAGA
ncbi:Rieske 2Fe-2S domain-containing protein [Streptomyces flaveus]|uniref:Phenoxybenzoate dioxygenase n=1 Tax=Streptomyces flaveus TaxID=66370 RepID=A0A917QNQ4_9ACTN|nr:Rieske 2Fe-2S domain-containing protein [Streptomyces flaveus]GGK60206.1 phenoxybenzoate dioxygenase [Streptomyces flaveus]